ncbi:MAG: hypothetical protein WBY53_10885 [Acidobacteriaceae bacterium]
MDQVLKRLRLSPSEVSSIAKRPARWITLPLLGLLLGSTGCAIHRVHSDYVGFEKAYADTSNRELLLNLARLQNHDPTYFFKMGQITSSYRMGASISSTGSYQSQSTIINKSNAIGSLSPGLTYENDPLFQFIPVSDETNAQLLLKSIPPETFYILYQQGWRVDQLLRVMVDRIEVTGPPRDGSGGCEITTYRNAPPSVHPGTSTPLDSNQLSSYATFLRIAAIAYALQKHGDLILRSYSTFVPLDSNAWPTGPSAAPGATDKKPASSAKENDSGAKHDGGDNSPPDISASDIEKAAEKNLSYELVNGKLLIGQRVITSKFFLLPPDLKETTETQYAPDSSGIRKVIADDPLVSGLRKTDALNGFILALHNGLTIEGDATPDQSENPCPMGLKQARTHLILRSLIGVMAAGAQEQINFDRLNNGTTMVKPLDKGTDSAKPFETEIPDIERQPILRITWKNEGGTPLAPPTQPLTELNYRGTEYLIADPKEAAVAENDYWNRDVFRLIGALTSQVTVDISKYPIANILQLNTQ